MHDTRKLKITQSVISNWNSLTYKLKVLDEMLKVRTLSTNLGLFDVVHVIKFILVASESYTSSPWLPQMDPSINSFLGCSPRGENIMVP